MPAVSTPLNTDTLGTATRYKPSKSRSNSGRKLYIEPKPLKFHENLNGYDQQQVSSGIEALASTPMPMEGVQQKARPASFRAKKSPGFAGNFIIKYSISPMAVTVTSIMLNLDVLVSMPNSKDERTALYEVERLNKITFNEGLSLAQVEELKESWQLKRPVTNVNTTHAAVNGMLNDLNKAAWLMGTHGDIAYRKDAFNDYTLFHNPSEGPKLDFYESVKDNLGITTGNAKQLAAVLRDVQLKGKPVKWIVHSQGGIIFKQALSHHIKNYGNASLNLNSVSFHAGGNNQKTTDRLLAKVGIKKENPDRNNPFDIVPNIAGGNDLSLASIKRSKQFLSKVTGSDSDSMVESPHTLPFLSLEAYRHFLVLAGDNTSAARVTKYMKQIN